MAKVNTDHYYQIRPSTRIISAIGDDLIKDSTAAIIELVKNAYDADATKVDVIISKESVDSLKVIIKDDGHGMSFDTVISKWMVPGTDDKLDRRKSPKGRQFQGRKGIGRFSVAIIGGKMNLTTVDNLANETKLSVDWEKIREQEFLDDIQIKIESEKVQKQSGTTIEVIGNKQELLEWNKNKFETLEKELRKLLIPVSNIEQIENHDMDNTSKIEEFKIMLTIKNFDIPDYEYDQKKIEPFPLQDMYDYRLYGIVNKDGRIRYFYEDFLLEKTEFFEEEIDLSMITLNGKIYFDFRVFDKDPEALDEILYKANTTLLPNSKLTKGEIRRALKDIAGISIYRNNFRIRPYGESGYDWLNLDKQRVQNPSFKVGSDQVVGFISIENEEISKIIEQSSREGLKENEGFRGLKSTLKIIINKLEIRRFETRNRSGRGRKRNEIEQQIEDLFDLDDITLKIESLLTDAQLDDKQVKEIRKTIKDTEKKKSILYNTIRDTIAIYQSQATLGKIVMVILHEGRKPLNWMKNSSKNIEFMINKLKKEFDEELLNTIIDRLETSKEQSENLLQLFKRLEPLSIKKKKNKVMVSILKSIKTSIQVFEDEIEASNIKVEINSNEDLKIKGWEEDLYIAFTNLLENSIYWLRSNNKKDKKINISVELDENNIIIEFIDNGKGIERKYLKDDLIFQTSFSTKNNGTGLGLTIAGEAIGRNDGKLEAVYRENGAQFRITFYKED